jgi:hypothetical protein
MTLRDLSDKWDETIAVLLIVAVLSAIPLAQLVYGFLVSPR